MTEHPTTSATVDAFFAGYARALLARDAEAIADRYHLPGLVVFPGNVVAVAERQQTVDFFTAAFGQYDGIDEVEPQVRTMAEAPGTVWADVTWVSAGRVLERLCYQLVEVAGGEGGYAIAVLTPLG